MLPFSPHFDTFNIGKGPFYEKKLYLCGDYRTISRWKSLACENGSSGLGNAVLHFLYFVPMQLVGFVQWRKSCA